MVLYAVAERTPVLNGSLLIQSLTDEQVVLFHVAASLFCGRTNTTGKNIF